MMAPMFTIGLCGWPAQTDSEIVFHFLLTVAVQRDLIEAAATRLPSNELLHQLGPQLVQREGVGERLAGRFQ